MVLASFGLLRPPPPSSSPLEDPYPVLLPPNSTCNGTRRTELVAAAGGTGHGGPERAPGRCGLAATPPRQRNCVEAVR
jgi:hypothetical protein